MLTELEAAVPSLPVPATPVMPSGPVTVSTQTDLALCTGGTTSVSTQTDQLQTASASTQCSQKRPHRRTKGTSLALGPNRTRVTS